MLLAPSLAPSAGLGPREQNGQGWNSYLAGLQIMQFREESDSDEETRAVDKQVCAECGCRAGPFIEVDEELLCDRCAARDDEEEHSESAAHGSEQGRRIDPEDGNPYTCAEFIEFYGDDEGAKRWSKAQKFTKRTRLEAASEAEYQAVLRGGGRLAHAGS